MDLSVEGIKGLFGPDSVSNLVGWGMNLLLAIVILLVLSLIHI